LTRSGRDFATFDGRPAGVSLRTGAPFARQPHACCTKSSLPRQKFGPHRNTFDCARPRAVRSGRWVLGSVVMFEAVTAFFGVMSAGIFIAHAVDGYRSRA
jgi:hypothetical protein